MNRKKLLIKETPLNGYMEDAFALSVAISRECSYEWIYSNYIQLVFQDPAKYDNQPIKFYKVSFKNGDIWDADCPLLCCDTITREMIESIQMDIIDFICISIEHNNYVKIFLDEFYLPYRAQYRNEHYIHENFFYGFDSDKKELYGLAYVTDNTGYNFKEFSVCMDAVRQAYNAAFVESVQKGRIMLMSCNREKYYEFDVNTVKNSIYEYINSVQTDQRYAEINNPNENYIFGINIYTALIHYYKNNKIVKSVIPLHIIYEHKKIMFERIIFMIENGYIGFNQDIIDRYAKLIKKAYLCKMKYLKYCYSTIDYNLENLINCINEIRNEEESLMRRLYLLLDNKIEYNHTGYIYSRWGLWKDVAYSFCKKLYNCFEISFYLHFINDKAQGYIRISNEECLSNYYAPFVLKFDVKKGYFMIADNFDENDVVLKNIRCISDNIYLIRFLINLDQRSYCVIISDKEDLVKYENIYSEEVSSKLQYINYLAAIHINSYRFGISKLQYKGNDGKILKLL